jgi:ketosteroid isomerase-like protein
MPATKTVTLFDEQEIRAAEKALEIALAAADRTAWVYEYTEDAVFDGGGEPLRGREALLGLAKVMSPMRDVSLRPLRTEGSGHLATVWFEGSWVSGPPGSAPTAARGMILWRKEDDGHWRVALEHLSH